MNDDTHEPNSLASLRLDELLEQLGSRSPVPGGGSVAGIANGLAAGLGGMVVAYSLGKKSLAEDQPMLEQTAAQLAERRTASLRQADDDAAAYGVLNALWRLDAEDPARRKGFPEAVQGAILAPGAIMETSLAILHCLENLPGHSARHLTSDLAIAVELACTAGRAAERNVSVNLPLVEDATLKDELDARYGALGLEIDTVARSILESLSTSS